MAITKEFIRLKITELTPYENNPRRNDNAVEDVMQSIKQCGELDPIEIDENNVILSGHTRLKAYTQMGFDAVDCVRYTGLTDEQKRKYRLLANKTGEKAEWDLDLLNIELDGMDFDGFDFGFASVETLEEFDLNELDDNTEKNKVVVFINCGDIANYEIVKERLENIAAEIDATISVKMA